MKDSSIKKHQIIALSERTRLSLEQINIIKTLSLPGRKIELLSALTDNGNTYLVYLEECAERLSDNKSINLNMIGDIKRHCDFVQSAWSELRDEAEQCLRK